MGRSPCCEKIGLKKGPWTPEEDQKLLAYIEEHGHGSWRALPIKAGLQRCGKSCRLRWTNYLRPDIKRGKFTLQEEQTIIQLHALLGNRWSAIATHLPKRTDNEIKNYWNTHLRKRLAKMGIDPVTHKPKNDTLFSNDGQSKHAANLSHMAQWESARLEAEARLVRQSKQRSNSFHHNSPLGSSAELRMVPQQRCYNGFWNGRVPPPPAVASGGTTVVSVVGIGNDLESPTSTLSYSENNQHSGMGDNSTAFIEDGARVMTKEGEGEGDEEEENWKEFENSNNMIEYKNCIENSISFTSSGLQELTMPPVDGSWATTTEQQLKPSCDNVPSGNFVQTFTDLLLNNSSSSSAKLSCFVEGCGESSMDGSDGNVSEYLEDNKNYWNSILNLVDSSNVDSTIF